MAPRLRSASKNPTKHTSFAEPAEIGLASIPTRRSRVPRHTSTSLSRANSPSPSDYQTPRAPHRPFNPQQPVKPIIFDITDPPTMPDHRNSLVTSPTLRAHFTQVIDSPRQPPGTPSHPASPLRQPPQRSDSEYLPPPTVVPKIDTSHLSPVERHLMDMHTAFTQSLTSLTTALQTSLSAVHSLPRASPPPFFDGSNVREWLRQAQSYYTRLNFSDSQALSDVICYLQGPALQYWCSLTQNDSSNVRRTWSDFADIMTQRFCRYGKAATITRLRALTFNGDIYELSDQFASILADGEPPGDELTRDIFLGLLPFSIASTILHDRSVCTWVDAREKLCRRMTDKAERCLAWWHCASPANRRDVLSKPDIMMEGWVPVNPQRGQQSSKASPSKGSRFWGGRKCWLA